jgi:hypothetical protein
MTLHRLGFVFPETAFLFDMQNDIKSGIVPVFKPKKEKLISAGLSLIEEKDPTICHHAARPYF